MASTDLTDLSQDKDKWLDLVSTVMNLNLGCLHTVACVRSRCEGISVYATLISKVNFTILYNCYMFRSYDHLQ
jgi:hypothetical protein